MLKPTRTGSVLHPTPGFGPECGGYGVALVKILTNLWAHPIVSKQALAMEFFYLCAEIQ